VGLAAVLGASPLLVFWIVLAAAVSDYLDGWIARRIHKTSYDGKILDFTADKIFLSIAILVMARAGAIDATIAGILAGYHLLVLLATTVISWGVGRPAVAIPTGERLVVVLSYVLACSAAGRIALPGKAVYSVLTGISGYIALAAVIFGAFSYLRLAGRMLGGYRKSPS